MANSAAIQVEGARETRKVLRDLSTDNEWRGIVKEPYAKIGSLTQDAAQSSARGGGVTLAGTSASMGSKAIGSIRGKGTTTGASLVAFKGIPWGPGWNFGSSGGHRQFPAKATPDHHLYKTVEDKRDEIVNVFADAIGDALERVSAG
jgi:hypothetical protein